MKAVVISLDSELAIGFHGVDFDEVRRGDLDYDLDERAARARTAWSWLVERFAEYSIPCTWAVVGHLLLESCDGTHSDRPADDDWFDDDPGGDETTAPGWFGSTLVRAIEESPVDHELGSHTFSHVELGAESTTTEMARWELARCQAVADERGHSLDSLVFPRGNIGHRDVVDECDYAAYRGHAADRWYDGSPIRPLGKALSYTVGRSPPPIREPRVDEHGLVEVPGSMHLFEFEGTARRVAEAVGDDPIVRQVKLGLEALTERDDGILHFWLHPNEVLADEDFGRVERVLALVDRYRTEHGIAVKTMGEVAAETLAEEGASVADGASVRR